MVVGSIGVGSVVVARVAKVPTIPGVPAVQQQRVRLGVRLGLGSGLRLPLLATVIPVVTKTVVAVMVSVGVWGVRVGEGPVTVVAQMMTVQPAVVIPRVRLGVRGCVCLGSRLGHGLGLALLTLSLHGGSLGLSRGGH